MKICKTVVVGYGGMGQFHCYAIGQLSYFELIGVFDVDPEKRELARSSGINAFESREAVAQSDAELVILAIPNDAHLEETVYYTGQDKHVLCEKPAALGCAQYREMMNAARKNGRMLMINQNRRFDRDFHIVKRIQEQGRLGNVYRIESRVQGANGIPGGWRKLPECGGGMLLDWGVHLLDQLLCLIPSKVVSVGCLYRKVFGFDVDDGFDAELGFENGVTAHITVGTNDYVTLPRWTIYGRDGTAVIEDWDCRGKMILPNYENTVEAGAIVAGNGLTKTMAYRPHETVRTLRLPQVEAPWDQIYRNMFESIRGEAKPIVTHPEQLRLLRLIEICGQAAQKNRIIKNISL